MAENSQNWITAGELSDLEVEQCVEEMFLPFSPAHELPQFMQMVSPRPYIAATPPSLPPELREEMMGLCAEIVQTAKAQPLQSLMICGVEPGVGAGFVAQNLSRALAEFRRFRIALLTVRSAHDQRHSNQRPSVPRRNFDYLLYRTERPNLMEISTAQGTITLTELLGGEGAAIALRQMQEEFDFIVVDSPPVTGSAEVAWLASVLDGVMLVAEPHVTSLRQMDRAYQRLHKARAKVLGVILNRQN